MADNGGVADIGDREEEAIIRDEVEVDDDDADEEEEEEEGA